MLVGQLVEDALDTPALEMFSQAAETLRTVTIPRWALIVLTLYMLLMLRLMQRTARNTLRDVRPAVKCDDATYAEIAARMTRARWLTDLVLAVIALGFVVVLLFPPPFLHSPIPTVDHPYMPNRATFLPSEPFAAFVVLVGYWLVGWTALCLLWNAVRLGKALGDLTQQPLELDVFGATNVLSLGRMALVLSLAPAGVIVILLIGLGLPTTTLSWFVFILASFASILALVLPLRGVHRQMEAVKENATREINLEFSLIQSEIFQKNAPDSARTAHLSNRTNVLVNLRKVVQEAPTWPFRDTVAITRALLIASAPLIYAVLNELIRIFFITPLTK